LNKNIRTSSKNVEQIISGKKGNFYKRLLKDTTAWWRRRKTMDKEERCM